MPSKTALYVSLSRKGSPLLGELRELFDFAAQSGCEVVATLGDVQRQPARRRRDHSDLAEAVTGMTRGDVGTVMGWTVERTGKSRQYLVLLPSKGPLCDYGPAGS